MSDIRVVREMGARRRGLPRMVNDWREQNIDRLMDEHERPSGAGMESALYIDLIDGDDVITFGLASMRSVTTIGAVWLASVFRGSYFGNTMKWHGMGTDDSAEATASTQLGAECDSTLSPPGSRVQGTLDTGATANIFKTVATLIVNSTVSVTEHGLFDQATPNTGNLWDRSMFAAIDVAASLAIRFTYELTINAGG